MNDMTKQFEQFAEMFKKSIPVVTPNRNGYEIRTKVLEFAQTQVWHDFHAKWGQFETKTVKDPKTGEIVTSVDMPAIPGAEQVLETAQQFYEFVSGNTDKNK